MTHHKISVINGTLKAAGAVLLVLSCILMVAASQPKPADKVDALLKKLKDAHPNVRAQAAGDLGKTKDVRAVPQLISALSDANSYVRGQAADALGEIKDARAVQPLAITLKEDSFQYVRLESARSLGRIKDARAIAPLINALNDEFPAVREASAKALVEIGTPAIEQMAKALKQADLRAVADAYYFYICRGEDGTEPALTEALLKYGTKRMAADFMYCGNSRLREAAAHWADSHGYKIKEQTDSDKGPVWGRCS